MAQEQESSRQPTGKQRATRIPMDYFKDPDRVQKIKRAVVWGASIVTLAWLGFGLLADSGVAPAPKWMATRYSHGPVAQVHQKWEAECERCHRSFSMLEGSPDPKHESCIACHKDEKVMTVQSEPHAIWQIGTPNCGACHRDHRGVEVDLTLMSDRFCTDCHRDLNAHMDNSLREKWLPSRRPLADKITGFATDHPPFHYTTSSEKSKDQGTIKFNHKYHMSPGIVLIEGGAAMTIRDLPEQYRDRYLTMQPEGQRDLDSAIRLTCASCHETPPEVPTKKGERAIRYPRELTKDNEVQPIKKPGAYMMPIKYEKHCAACHPLNVDPALSTPIKHGIEPEQVKREIASRFRALKNPEKLFAAPTITRPLPGRKPGMRGTGDVKALLQQKIDSSIRIMLGSRRGCAECHFMDEASDRVQRMEKSRELIPEIWLKHTQFNHDAHNLKDTGLKCVDCHRGADLEAKTDFSSEILASSKMPRKGAEELMMPTIDDCRVCHSASSPKAQAPFERVAADHRCVECHLYHRGTPHGK